MPKNQADRKHARPKGSVQELVRGKKYRIRATLGYDTARKAVTRAETVTGTKADAVARLAEMQSTSDAQRLNRQPAQSLTLAALAQRWWENEPNERTQHTNRERTRYFLAAFPSGFLAGDLRRQDVYDRLLDSTRFRALAPRMQRHIVVSLKAMCNYAVARNLLTVSPCVGVKAPKVSAPPSRTPLTVAQMDRLRSQAASDREPLASLIAILCETAMRPSEARALQWSDLTRLPSGAWVLHIGHAMSKGLRGGEKRGATKTRKARTITIRQPFAEALAAQRGAAAEDAYIWLHSCDAHRPVCAKALNHALQSAAKGAELDPRLTAYVLRHSAISAMAAADPKKFPAISARVGTGPATLLATYVHPFLGDEATLAATGTAFATAGF